jgi:hypothetical protein
MKKLLLFLFIATIVSCKVTFVPTKSQTALDVIQQIQQDANNAFYTANYDEAAYSKASDDIDSLISFDKSRAKAGFISKQDDRIKTLFDEFRSEHKAKGSIGATEQGTYKSYFKSAIDARTISEQSLK